MSNVKLLSQKHQRSNIKYQTFDPLKVYKEHLALLNDELSDLLRKKNWLAWLRFLSIMAAGLAPWQLWSFNWIFALITSLLLIALFLFFVTRDINNRESIENTKRLADINEEEINILVHHFTNRPDGQSFQPEHHDYANDLDLVRQSIPYQYINRTHSAQGNKLFADWLLRPAQTELIQETTGSCTRAQLTIFSLQQFRSYSIANPITIASEENVMKWLHQQK
jgi:hypothetical protein